MQMIVLIVFAVVLSLGVDRGPRVGQLAWGGLAAWSVGYLLGAIGLTWALTRAGMRDLMSEVKPFAAAVRGQHRRMVLAQAWLVGGMMALVLLGASDVLRSVTLLAMIPLGGELVLLGLFFLSIAAYWRITFRFDQEVRWQVEQDLMLAGLPVRAGWNARQHMAFNIRHHFLFVAVPVGLIMLAHDLVDRIAPRFVPAETLDLVSGASKMVAVGLIFFFSPALLVRIWKTRPMPDGELRRRLDRLCDRIGLRYRKILIWDTAGVVANAGVMGLHHTVRYVLISDALLEQMTDRQIVAVFGHEAGHVKAHHMAYFLLFMAGGMMTCMTAVTAAAMLAHRMMIAPKWIAIGEHLGLAALMAAGVGVGFGWLSRRFERQADVYGAWCAGLDAESNGEPSMPGGDLAAGGAAFIGALEDIARLNGLARDGRNWRHGSIRSRVLFLIGWIGRGLSRKDFDREIVRVKLWAWLMALVAVIGTALTYHAWE